MVFFPTSSNECIVILILGLLGGGSWPAVRQCVNEIDYKVGQAVHVL